MGNVEDRAHEQQERDRIAKEVADKVAKEAEERAKEEKEKVARAAEGRV
jgi:hypothetical protein